MAKKRKKRRTDNKKMIRAVCMGVAALLVLCLTAYRVSILMEKRTYRLEYAGTIKQYAEEYRLDPGFVAAVIHCESANDPMAVSRVGARGLMQIMPDTGRWIAGKIEIDGFGDDDLFDPDTNIRMGCWYLRYLLDKFSGDRRVAVAAYNAGPGNAEKWLEDEKYSAEGSLEVIPFPETYKYVEKVQRAYEKYISLYEKELY